MFKAGDIMRFPVIKINEDASVADAVDLLLKHDISGLPVVDRHGRLVGMFSQVDQIGQAGPAAGNRKVSSCMSTDVVSVDVDQAASDVAAAFRSMPFHRLAVTRHDRVVGIIGCRDLVAFVRKLEQSYNEFVPIVAEVSQFSFPQVWCNAD